MDGCLRLTSLFACCLAAAGCVAQRLPTEQLTAAPTDGPSDPNAPPQAPVPVSPYAKSGAQAWAGDQPAAAAPSVPTSRYSNNAPEATPPGGAIRPATDADLQKIAAELQALGTVDPATQNQLLADLRQTDPALWPMLMQTFRAGAAYRGKTAAAEQTAPPQPDDAAPKYSVQQTSATESLSKTSAAAPSPQSAPPPSTPASVAPSQSAMATEMLRSQLAVRGPSGASGGLSLPTETLLQAAVEQAQRIEAEGQAPPPPAVATTQQPDVVAAASQPASSPTSSPSPTTPEKPAAVDAKTDWRDALGDSIAALEKLTAEPPDSEQEVSQHAQLRMLYLAAGRRDDALKPIPGISAAEQDYWREQLYTLATCLDNERISDPAKRSAEARIHLAKADSRLAEASTLTVRNLAFCTEVASYGVYEKFKESKFKANQPLILYAEVQNFRSEQSEKGFHTALRGSYQILDAQGRRVAEGDLALTEEYCRNERRDYFIRYFLSVPERIYDGRYTLQLTIVDTLSKKIGQSTIDFTVGTD